MINQIDSLIRRETQKAIRAILESNLSQDSSDEERKRQQDQKKSVTSRDLKAHDGAAEKKDEASDEEDENSKDENLEDKREDRSKGRGTADSPKLKVPKQKQLQNPQAGAVVDKLNALRGGKSLKDPEVRKSFEQYFNGLNIQEKQSLLLFLTGIAQILAGTEAGSNALEPGDAGLRVQDKPSGSDKTIKKSSSKSNDSDQEGTTANPIVVGEVASKFKIMEALKAYKDNS